MLACFRRKGQLCSPPCELLIIHAVTKHDKAIDENLRAAATFALGAASGAANHGIELSYAALEGRAVWPPWAAFRL